MNAAALDVGGEIAFHSQKPTLFRPCRTKIANLVVAAVVLAGCASAPKFPASGTAIAGATIYASPAAPALMDGTILLSGGEIVDVASAAARLEEQADAGTRAVKLFNGAIVGKPVGVLPMDAGDVRRLTDTARRRDLPVFVHPADAVGLNVTLENGVGILAYAAPFAGAQDSTKASALVARGLALAPALHEAGGDILFGTD
ncbi:MAG: hypothetical protein WEA77_06050, partial [Hyphomonas sp.]